MEAFMLAKRTLIVALAAAIAIAFSPLPELTAAPFWAPGSQTGSGDLVQSAQAKKEASKKKASKKKAGKRKKAKRKKAKVKTAKPTKSCGTFKYRKGGKCVDARDKK
jgi:hypothetical protein